jgi:diacylglycerol diphosphate phosphatase/phosphatidate phosphatase
MIAISRLEDYRHDVGDVVTGSALGFTVAYFNWRRYFPSLLAKGCDEPHPSPDGSSNGGFRRVRDEEESLGRNVEQYNLGDE